MSTATQQQMTLEEFRQLPEDPAVERELLNGVLVERPMTRRNRWHAAIEAKVAFLLNLHVVSGGVSGKVFSGEIGCDLPTVNAGVGIDVAYFDDETLSGQNSSDIVGAPVLAVEILSPTDVIDNIKSKVENYLIAGTQQIWIIDPHFRTVTIYRPDHRPEMFSEGQQFSCEPALVGLTITVDDIFS